VDDGDPHASFGGTLQLGGRVFHRYRGGIFGQEQLVEKDRAKVEHRESFLSTHNATPYMANTFPLLTKRSILIQIV
jgi:hypothetical protein